MQTPNFRPKPHTAHQSNLQQSQTQDSGRRPDGTGLEITSPKHSNKLYNTYVDCLKTAQVALNSVTYARFSRTQAHGGADYLQRVNTSIYVRL